MAYTSTITEGAGGAEYTIRHQGGCVLIFGSVPANQFKALSKLAPRRAVIDTAAAEMAGASFVFGLTADLDKLKKSLADPARRRAASRYAGLGLSTDKIDWLATGERGSSSNAMFQHLTGVQAVDKGRNKAAHPLDPDDVKRCRLLLEHCPALQVVFDDMRTLSPTWARLVDAWPAICAAMDAESPQWREGKGKAPHTYSLIKQAIDG